MKQAVILAFTDRGRCFSEKVQSLFGDGWYFTDLSGETNKKEALAEVFDRVDMILFISATGIAVRFISHLLKDKYTDPAVICMDERGQFVIPLCSGHVGGGNGFAREIAKRTGAIPVITTATDVNGKFAVDVFAKKNQFLISDRNKAKEISARILKGEKIALYSVMPLKGEKPDEIELIGTPEQADVVVDEVLHPGTLSLLARPVVIGVGCRKGTPVQDIVNAIKEALCLAGKKETAIGLIASIDVKKNEEGIVETARQFCVPFVTYSAEELETITDVSKESEFVKKIVGTGNVCERAALLGSGGTLLLPKTAIGRVTVSVAQKKKEGIF